MAHPKISVLLPIYNGMPWLPQTMESLLAQSYRDFEILALDDGSQDGTLECLQGFSKQDARVYVRSRSNRGLIATLNELLDWAQGEYLARMDADDLSLPQRLERQVELAERMQLDLCGSHFQVISEEGQVRETYAGPLSQEGCWAFLASAPPFAHGSLLLRRSFLQRHALRYGQTEFRRAEDYALWVQCALAGARMGNVDAVLFQYRVTGGSLSRSKQWGIFRDAARISRHILQEAAAPMEQNVLAVLHSPTPFSPREQWLYALATILLLRKGKYRGFLLGCRRIPILAWLKAWALFLKRYAFL